MHIIIIYNVQNSDDLHDHKSMEKLILFLVGLILKILHNFPSLKEIILVDAK